MLFLSKYPFKTLKNTPKWSENKWTWLLLQAWYIRQELAWVYNYLHFWLKTIKKIENIIRQELDSIWATEIYMSAFSNKESWQKTNRWDEIDVLFKVPASGNKEYALNPTHEEIVTPLLREFIQSYKDLENCSVYQFQTKFRNEARAKSWILRWREFLMKDLYSFNSSEEELDKYFEIVKNCYVRIFDKLWIGHDTLYTFASWWAFSKYSYEFQTILDIWEDEIFICKKCLQSHNKEIVSDIFECVNCNSKEYDKFKASESWNIFKLSTRFSDDFGLKFTDKDGKEKKVYMWCYWIGVSRIMWIIAEKLSDEKWLVWPEEIAPFSHYIIVHWDYLEEAIELAKKLENSWKEIIIDDRNIWFWQKAFDADLLWIPYKVIISEKTVRNNNYEIINRTDNPWKHQ